MKSGVRVLCGLRATRRAALAASVLSKNFVVN